MIFRRAYALINYLASANPAVVLPVAVLLGLSLGLLVGSLVVAL